MFVQVWRSACFNMFTSSVTAARLYLSSGFISLSDPCSSRRVSDSDWTSLSQSRAFRFLMFPCEQLWPFQLVLAGLVFPFWEEEPGSSAERGDDAEYVNDYRRLCAFTENFCWFFQFVSCRVSSLSWARSRMIRGEEKKRRARKKSFLQRSPLNTDHLTFTLWDVHWCDQPAVWPSGNHIFIYF